MTMTPADIAALVERLRRSPRGPAFELEHLVADGLEALTARVTSIEADYVAMSKVARGYQVERDALAAENKRLKTLLDGANAAAAVAQLECAVLRQDAEQAIGWAMKCSTSDGGKGVVCYWKRDGWRVELIHAAIDAAIVSLK